jgi:hypothetical protein
MGNQALEPLFQTVEPNDPILLHSGPAVLHGNGVDHRGSIQVRVDWTPVPAIAFDLTIDGPIQFLMGDVELEILSLSTSCRGFISRQVVQGGPDFQTVVSGSVDRVRVEYHQAIMSAKFHLTNFVDYSGEPIERNENGRTTGWVGRVIAAVPGWILTLDSVESNTRLTEMARRGGYYLTHVGDVHKADGSSFTSGQLFELMDVLRLSLSFARGLWVAPLLVVGFDSDGTRVCEDWTMYPLDRATGHFGWFPSRNPGTLGHFLEGFLSRWSTADLREPLELAISWYLEASRSRVAQPAIAIEQMGLELVSWLMLVRDGKMLSPAGFHRMEAHDQLRLLLGWIDVGADFPVTLSHLRAFGHGSQPTCDAPEAFTRIRNRIVHPPKSSQHPVPAGAMFDAQQLGLWYLELALLNFLSYAGPYSNRMAAFQEGLPPWG